MHAHLKPINQRHAYFITYAYRLLWFKIHALLSHSYILMYSTLSTIFSITFLQETMSEYCTSVLAHTPTCSATFAIMHSWWTFVYLHSWQTLILLYTSKYVVHILSLSYTYSRAITNTYFHEHTHVHSQTFITYILHSHILCLNCTLSM